jgi:hypothetical protein
LIPDNFGIFYDLILPAADCNGNEYQEYFLGDKGGPCIRLDTLTPSYAYCLEILEPQPPETLRACPKLYRD